MSFEVPLPDISELNTTSLFCRFGTRTESEKKSLELNSILNKDINFFICISITVYFRIIYYFFLIFLLSTPRILFTVYIHSYITQCFKLLQNAYCNKSTQ